MTDTLSQTAGQAIAELTAVYAATRDVVLDAYRTGRLTRPQMEREIRAAVYRYHDGAEKYGAVLWEREMSRA